MSQFTLTKNAANRLKVKDFSDDQSLELPFFDNWLIHITKISRYDVIFFAHIQTRIILSIPVFEVGSAKKALDAFPIMLEEIMDQASVSKQIFIGNTARKLYDEQEITFCKAGINTRSVNAHITQYKSLLNCYAYEHKALNKLSCAVTSSKWLDFLIKTPDSKDYVTPQNLFLEQLRNYEEEYLGGEIIH
jgi:hypothetical protein